VLWWSDRHSGRRVVLMLSGSASCMPRVSEAGSALELEGEYTLSGALLGTIGQHLSYDL